MSVIVLKKEQLPMQFVRRALAAGCCAVILSAGLQAAASEKIVDIDYLKITSDGFVADTLNGVEARYNLGGPRCTAPSLSSVITSRSMGWSFV